MDLRPIARPALARLRRWRLRRALLRSDDLPPTLDVPISQAVTYAQMESDVYRRWCAELREEPIFHRKQWEHVYVLRVLEQRGMLRPGVRGVGFGVGREPIPAVLAARGCEVLATDQPLESVGAGGWRETGQYAGTLAALNERGLCDPLLFAERVHFAAVDMRALSTVRGGPFDFLWSCCALEHLGSLEAGVAFVAVSFELLRPGGVAVHTTELNVASDERTIERAQTVLYRRRDLEALARELRARGNRIEQSFHLGDRPEDCLIDIPPYRARVHLKVLHTKHATTSFGLLIERGGDGRVD